jgi:hypothetical protein
MSPGIAERPITTQAAILVAQQEPLVVDPEHQELKGWMDLVVSYGNQNQTLMESLLF